MPAGAGSREGSVELDAQKLTGDLSFDGGRGVTHDATRKGDWMQTYSGGRFYVADPRPAEIVIADVAMALATKTRYNGHCLFYSVAEHSVLVSKLVSPEHAKHGLLHDIAESYIPDIARPVKRVLGKENDIFRLDESITVVGLEKFGLDPVLPQEVTLVDVAICKLERRVLHARADEWLLGEHPEPEACIQGLDWFEAGEAFLRRYAELWEVPFDVVWQPWFKMVSADMERLRLHREEHEASRVCALPQLITASPR